MVFPAQNPAVSSIVPPENLPLPETPGVRNVPEFEESVSELFPPTPDQQKPTPETREQGPDKDGAQSEPGQIVDLSKSKVKDTPVQTSDKITTIADDEEKTFREKVDSTAHEQHS